MILEGHFQIGRLASCHTAQSLFQHTCTEKKISLLSRECVLLKSFFFFLFFTANPQNHISHIILCLKNGIDLWYCFIKQICFCFNWRICVSCYIQRHRNEFNWQISTCLLLGHCGPAGFYSSLKHSDIIPQCLWTEPHTSQIWVDLLYLKQLITGHKGLIILSHSKETCMWVMMHI